MKGKTIKKGTKLYVNYLKSGVTNGKRWQFFNMLDSKKDNKGENVVIQRYTIFVSNPQEDLTNGQTVIVEEIEGVQAFLVEKDGVLFRNITVNIKIQETTKTQEEKDFEEAFNAEDFCNFEFNF